MKRRDRKRASVEAKPPVAWLDRAVFAGLALLHFVCPLLFFTNLTRNPYFTQIALLNIGISAVFLVWIVQRLRAGELIVPRVPFSLPLAIFLAFAFATTVLSWADHAFVRPGIRSEAVRIWIFTLINSVLALYMPILFQRGLGDDRPPNIWADIAFCLVWGLGWLGFHAMRDPSPQQLIWDPYGAFLWCVGAIYAYRRAGGATVLGIYHLVFSVCLLAGGYGLLQYMGRDVIWSSPIQPYGGRPISTFGNPNFMSSYLLLASPIATALAMRAPRPQAIGYFIVAAVCILSALATLTRSTIVGLVAAFAAFALFLFRRDHLRYVKWAGAAVAAILVVIAIFPATPVGAIQSPLNRFLEIFDAIKSGEPYGPWHQRVLIWSSAWDMVLERPFFGKGWGLFELFYPFYQGGHILTDMFRPFRTHANNAHNIVMEIWSQVGVIGMGLATWFGVTLFAGGWRIFKSKPADHRSRFFSAAILAGFVGMLVDNFFGNVSIFFAVPAFLFWWSAGSIYRESAVPVVRRAAIAGRRGRSYAGVAVLGCLCVWASVYYVRRWKQETLYFEGFKLAKTDKIVASYKALERAYAWFPYEVNTNYELGNSYSRHAKSLESRAATLESEGLADRAKRYRDEARRFHRKAIDAYQAALAANPGYDEIYFNTGMALMTLEDEAEAERYLRLALYINPLLRDAYGSLANLYAKRNDPAAAAATLEKAVAAFPDDKNLWLNLGYFRTQTGDDAAAFEAFKRAYALDPKFVPAWNNLQLAARRLGRTEPLVEFPRLVEQMESAVSRRDFVSAHRAAERIVALFPEDADARLSLGNILFYLGRPDEAINEMETALSLRPRFAAAHLNLAGIYRSLRRPAAEREALEALLAYDPDNPEARERLSELAS